MNSVLCCDEKHPCLDSTTPDWPSAPLQSSAEVLRAGGKTPKWRLAALKGRGFSGAVHHFQKTYGTAGKPCPFKTSTPQNCSENSSAMPQLPQYQARLQARLEAAPFQTPSAEKQ
jgi:hypothetical protein